MFVYIYADDVFVYVTSFLLCYLLMFSVTVIPEPCVTITLYMKYYLLMMNYTFQSTLILSYF